MTQSPKQMAGAQRRSLKSLQKKIEAMASEWADVDEFNMNELYSLARRCEEISETMVADPA